MSRKAQRRYGGKSEPYTKVWQEGRSKRVHLVLAEQKLGRKLKPGEVVHNLEGFLDDPGNLQVYPSQRHHMVVHHYQRQESEGVQHLFSLEEVLELMSE